MTYVLLHDLGCGLERWGSGDTQSRAILDASQRLSKETISSLLEKLNDPDSTTQIFDTGLHKDDPQTEFHSQILELFQKLGPAKPVTNIFFLYSVPGKNAIYISVEQPDMEQFCDINKLYVFDSSDEATEFAEYAIASHQMISCTRQWYTIRNPMGEIYHAQHLILRDGHEHLETFDTQDEAEESADNENFRASDKFSNQFDWPGE